MTEERQLPSIDVVIPMSGSWSNRGLLCRVYKVKGEEMP